jgi:hypothetical protein
MWTMATSALSLFLRGQLFANPRQAYARLAMGIGLIALLCIILTVTGMPVWAAAMIAGFIGGGLQTYLFKTVRFR